jgi:hypothetical protein
MPILADISYRQQRCIFMLRLFCNKNLACLQESINTVTTAFADGFRAARRGGAPSGLARAIDFLSTQQKLLARIDG